ncbi:zinc ribbon domain-containing protein [Salidesulfovibrio onnuriiensis]|uniref:zinc ribbon domain-containing protein n=1 Tax=Salidesulfovibrio onnuriiensis TaxID=2583823 RepID=UPI0011CB1497|nr:C4-type zinc ribbon domain-containing protein [Salidesulfovibrio onnuriiensis]
MYQKQIEQLVVLQRVDDEIIVLQEDLTAAPRELRAMEEKLEGLDARKAQVEEKLDILKQQQKKLGIEIDEDDAKIKKSKNKLMMASNTKEYHAMMREMDSLEKLNRIREDESTAVKEELLRQTAAMEAVEEEIAGVKEEYNAKKATLDERVAEAEKALEGLNKKRDKACKVVPPPILGRYEFIRSRLENPVIVPVEEGVCCGCNIMIPPQKYIDLQKGQQILSCPNCQRLIYWKEHIPEAAKVK